MERKQFIQTIKEKRTLLYPRVSSVFPASSCVPFLKLKSGYEKDCCSWCLPEHQRKKSGSKFDRFKSVMVKIGWIFKSVKTIDCLENVEAFIKVRRKTECNLTGFWLSTLRLKYQKDFLRKVHPGYDWFRKHSLSQEMRRGEKSLQVVLQWLFFALSIATE